MSEAAEVVLASASDLGLAIGADNGCFSLCEMRCSIGALTDWRAFFFVGLPCHPAACDPLEQLVLDTPIPALSEDPAPSPCDPLEQLVLDTPSHYFSDDNRNITLELVRQRKLSLVSPSPTTMSPSVLGSFLCLLCRPQLPSAPSAPFRLENFIRHAHSPTHVARSRAFLKLAPPEESNLDHPATEPALLSLTGGAWPLSFLFSSVFFSLS